MRRAATQYILCLLPEEWECEEFGEIGTDKSRARYYATRDIAPVGAIEAIAYGSGLSSYTRSERCAIQARVATENEVESTIYRRRVEYLGVRSGSNVFIFAEIIGLRYVNLRCKVMNICKISSKTTIGHIDYVIIFVKKNSYGGKWCKFAICISMHNNVGI